MRYWEALGLPDAAFTLLRDLIHERTGLFYENSKRDIMADKLAERVLERGLSSYLDYYYFLKYDEGAAQEWGRVMDALSVGETYFWREADQLRALVDLVVPQFFAQQPGATLRIWSAACATGEEPLSIAMALNEAGWFERANIEIVGSDASPRAIEGARRGLYRERSFRSLSAAWREKYFAPEGDRWRVSPALHARVRWQTANLLEEAEIAPLAAAHVIFCRNVFIYFSEDAIRRVLRVFHARMRDPAYLFVGVSESLLRLTTDFAWRELGGAFVYIRQRV